jgi:Helix-hairpin-helix containing domain
LSKHSQRTATILAALMEQNEVREIMVFLRSHDVCTARAVRIFKTYGADAIEVMNRESASDGVRHLAHRVQDCRRALFSFPCSIQLRPSGR